MYKTQRSIANEVEKIKQVLLPSKVVVLHMWRPTDDSRRGMSEAEILAKGHRENSRVILIPYSDKPDQSELKQYLESMAREEGAKQE